MLVDYALSFLDVITLSLPVARIEAAFRGRALLHLAIHCWRWTFVQLVLLPVAVLCYGLWSRRYSSRGPDWPGRGVVQTSLRLVEEIQVNGEA